jgi:hypothetical protein
MGAGRGELRADFVDLGDHIHILSHLGQLGLTFLSNPHAFHRLCVVKQQKKLYVQCLASMTITLWVSNVAIHNRPELQSKNS